VLAQYQKSCDINFGTGQVTIALASLVIGTSLVSHGSVLRRVSGVVLGSCLYRVIIAVALRFHLPGECLKLVSAIIVATAISAPYLGRNLKFMQQKKAMYKEEKAESCGRNGEGE
jgi:putative ABC transport system permease protein